MVRHAVDVQGARCVIVSKTIKEAKEGGVWSDLIDLVLPQWIDAGITKYVTTPRLDGQTRSLYFDLANRYGGATRCYLQSLDYDDDAERVFKSRRFSFIAFSELSKFRKRIVFDTSIQSLRMPGVPYKLHQWIGDTNPDMEARWIYDLWWGTRTLVGFPEECKTDEQKRQFRDFQKSLALHEIMIPDNPFLSQEEKDSLIASYQHSQDLYNRYILGLWVEASAEGFFSEVFRDEVHIVGNRKSINPDEWEILLPPENTHELFMGIDPGDKNTAVIFAYKTRDQAGNNYWGIIDEICYDDTAVNMADLVSEIMQIRKKWAKVLGRSILWRDWSDNSAFNFKLAASATEHIAIRNLSGGEIRLQAADKYAGAILDAIDLMKRMFMEGRLVVSASCPHMIECFKSIRPQKSRINGTISVPSSKWKHKLDAFRYMLMSEEPRDMSRTNHRRTGVIKPRIVAMA